GAAADINRALQTFPGVQLPGEGNALFVRGGDSFETVTLVNGLRYPNPHRFETPPRPRALKPRSTRLRRVKLFRISAESRPRWCGDTSSSENPCLSMSIHGRETRLARNPRPTPPRPVPLRRRRPGPVLVPA
ncbi:MAG: Plug domain-containing protein, partial [Opitutaceae bacterium]|nr:Plug domain-containing protein [Opitutaceae bacterium]